MDRRYITTTSRTAKLILLATKNDLILQSVNDEEEDHSSIVEQNQNTGNVQCEKKIMEQTNDEEGGYSSIVDKRKNTGNVQCEGEITEQTMQEDSIIQHTNNEDREERNTEEVIPLQQRYDKDYAWFSTSDDGDFGSSSCDDFILGTDENIDSSSCDSIPKKKKKKKCNQKGKRKTSHNIMIAESESSSEEEQIPQDEAGCSFWINNGMTNQGKRRKPRKAEKERREDRLKRQLLRNRGLEYITQAGSIKKSREMQELNDCRQKCKERLHPDLRKKLFEEYWSLGSSEKRAAYMGKCIEIRKKKSSKSSPKKRRSYSNNYYVFTDNFQKNRICKGCLLRTFDESHRFLQTVCEKKVIFGRIPERKRRNTKSIPDEKLEEIKSHINSFPSTDSHYSRAKTTKRFLNSELTLQKMYDLYKEKFQNPASKTIYSNVFKCLNLSFKKPSLDTCSKCDSINMKLKYVSGEEAISLEKELKRHQLDFQAAYDEKRADKERAKSSEDVAVFAFDLQQCLPTPFLKTNVAFYKRQLWTYNLTIHDLKTDKAFCYMWPECTGGRGANDVASCLYDFIINQLPLLHSCAKHLIMYSDNCPGQNKNSIVTSMSMLAAKLSPQLNTIEHKFLIPGHTHMEADSDHDLIERKKKRTTMDIHLPRDWYQLVRTASNRTSKLIVIEMNQDMFYDFGDFAKQYLTLRKSNQSNDKFIWANIRCLKYTKTSFPRFFYKEELGVSDFLSIDYSKRGKDYNLITINIVKKSYLAGIPVSAEKKKDLCQLLPFIHESAHEFYRNLSCKADIRDTAAYDDSSEDE